MLHLLNEMVSWYSGKQLEVRLNLCSPLGSYGLLAICSGCERLTMILLSFILKMFSAVCIKVRN